MKPHRQPSTWTGASLLLTLILGAPAVADDTELMLVTPATAEDNKPNILFILDTSGSMGEVVETQAPYDHTRQPPYPGACDADKLYWTDVDVTPDCSDAGNTQFFAKSAFVCQAAAGQLAGIGLYTGTMVQHRVTGDPEVSRWQELAPGNATNPVECQADSGVHGDGSNGADLWASNGSDGKIFTANSALEIAWGSAPAAVTYTVYDGNYLNWKNAPQTVQLAKMEILKAVTTAVLNSISDVNVGIMRFQGSTGGSVIKAMGDLDTQRQEILATIDGLPANGNTPLSETMYEAARYWRGMDAHYVFDPSRTDPAALDVLSPENYRQPETNVCSKNFNVLVTDGEPVSDEDAPGLVASLPDFGTSCDGTGMGSCLDDIAGYLNTVDIDAVATGDQLVTTHTIGFDIDLALLRETAEDGDGTYFLADDVDTLAQALLNIISDITQRSLSFSAPAISVNSFNRTQNLNDLYMTVFASRTNVHWPGNLKKFAIKDGQIVDANGTAAVDPSTGFFNETAKSLWTDGNADGNDVILGGAAHELPAPASRNLYTNNGANANLSAAVNAINSTNAGAFTAADFGLTGAAGEPTMDELIRWMRGEDIRNEDFDASTTVRNAMGDPLHSQPAAVVYGGVPNAPDVVVFTATNDGYLHAVDGDTGEELWAFVPKELLSDMNRLFFDPRSNFKHYGIDGNVVPVVFDDNNNGLIESTDGDFVYILFGLRRGGNSYYALDVTDRNTPELLWISQLPEFGQTWSTPVVSRVNIQGATQNQHKAVVIIGGGYDPVHDTRAYPSAPDAQGAGIHMLDLVTGNRLWHAGPDLGTNPLNYLPLDRMTRAIPTTIRVIDMNGDGTADRMYASDLGGQIWRFDISNGKAVSELVAGGVIARLGAEGLTNPTDADSRRFYTSPDVAIFNDPFQGRRFVSVSIGSGYRAHPLDNTAADRFFSIRDPDVFNPLTKDQYDNYDIITDADLVEVSGQFNVVIDSDDRGWMFTLPADQKVLADSVTFNDSVFFVAFSPDVNNANPCQPGTGVNFLYQVNIVNGDPIVAIEGQVPTDPDAERATRLAQSGIAPTPTFLFPGATDPDCTGAACAEPPIACIGAECVNPGHNPRPIRTLWKQDGIE